MSQSSSSPFRHQPVMLDEVVALITAPTVPGGLVVDCTLGGGGHAAALLEARDDFTLLGLDQDEDALAASAQSLGRFADRAHLRHARFDQLADHVGALGFSSISAALFDLGVSSPQLDRAERGFSYREDAPLDMRMDRSAGRTAADVVNTADENTLTRLFVDNGEGRFARRIARSLIAARPVTTTGQLVEIVRASIPAPARRTGGHPAKRVFQALRIEVNDELEVLPVALDAALGLLTPGGRCVVLAYHSGEDRLVKDRFLAAESGGCTCPPNLPCGCGARGTVRLLNRGSRKPSADEIALNPRAESARLRAAERLAPTTPDTAPDGSIG